MGNPRQEHRSISVPLAESIGGLLSRSRIAGEEGEKRQASELSRNGKSAHTETQRHKENQTSNQRSAFGSQLESRARIKNKNQLQHPHLPKFPKGGETGDVRREILCALYGFISCRRHKVRSNQARTSSPVYPLTSPRCYATSPPCLPKNHRQAGTLSCEERVTNATR